ncbi:hypothetical protein [Streptomyces cadmiisoli]|uniref:hypothetical protein n=1 Tax=Streptomyces cadmiisoli TaxID=2184053 RepID=UPI003D736F12
MEAGVERVTDGIPTEPLLAKGRTYRLNVVCACKGSAQLRFTPPNSGDKATVPCDGSVVQQRIRAVAPSRIDGNGDTGASGMIAWQMDKS